MAYINQEKKRELALAIKAILKKYGLKGTLSINNNTTLTLTIRSGKIDFSDIKNYQINTYHPGAYNPKYNYVLAELIAAMNVGNFDHSDLQSDYFCIGWYINLNIGTWDKPYVKI